MIIPLVDLAYGKTRVIEPRLPFLYESKFMATIISSFDKRGIGAHAYRLLCPFHKRRASSAWASLSWVSWRNFLERLYSQSKSMVRCRPNVKFGLHVHRAREANVDALGQEKRLGKKIVGNQRRAPQVIENHSGLDDAKALKKRKCGSHGEGCDDIDDKNHRMESLQMGLKHLVLEFST